MSKKANIALVRKAEQKKILPYSVVYFNSAAEALTARDSFRENADKNSEARLKNKLNKAYEVYFDDSVSCHSSRTERAHVFRIKRKYLIFKETICTRCGYKLTKEKRN